MASIAWSSRTAPAPPTSARPKHSWMTSNASSSSPTPAVPGVPITRSCRRRIRRLRMHYLLEAGWKADAAIQGLGRTTPQTHWREADRDTFARAWAAEIAEVPEFYGHRDPHRRWFTVADLEAPAERVRPGSIGCRPTPASALSAARSHPRGSPVRWKPERRISRQTPPSPR